VLRFVGAHHGLLVLIEPPLLCSSGVRHRPLVELCWCSLNPLYYILFVVTIALGLRLRQGLARLQAKREAQGLHLTLSRVQKSLRE